MLDWFGFYRAMLCTRGTSQGPVSVRVCLCLCLSQVGVLLKRLNRGSHEQHHTIVGNSSFLVPQNSAKFDRSHPLRGRRMPAISRKRYKIDAWFLLKSYSKSYAHYRMVTLPITLSAPNHPKLPHFLHFAPLFIAS